MNSSPSELTKMFEQFQMNDPNTLMKMAKQFGISPNQISDQFQMSEKNSSLEKQMGLFSDIKTMSEQFRRTEKISRETPPYYPRRKVRSNRISEYNMYKIEVKSFNHKQTWVTADKHSSKIKYEDLSKLEPIKIRSMMVNKIHYGKYLICRVIEEPYKVCAISLLVEDENGEIEDLSIYNYPETDTYLNLFSKGTVLYIKEPFFKLPKDGLGSFIRIDSPSDMLIDDYEHSGKFRNELRQFHQGKNPEDIKKYGNAYYQKNQFELAMRCYKVALSISSHQSFILQLNCSAAYLALKMSCQAHSEASKALKNILKESPKDQNKWLEKATFRMGNALYQMRQWKEAIENLHECLKSNSKNQEALSLLEDTKLRIKEQETGEFDFLQIYEKFQANKIYDLDIADYHDKNLEIQENSKKGRHIIAKADIPRGTLICVSKAFSFGRYIFNKMEIPMMSINLVTNLCDMPDQTENLLDLCKKVQSNPFLAKEVYSLYSHNMFDRKEIIPDNIVDISRLECIASMNSFDGEDSNNFLIEGLFEKKNDQNSDRNCGLWIYPSLFNHSCVSNTVRNFIGDILILHSCRDIKKNEEITISYVSPLDCYEERKKKLEKFGFICDCELCDLDRIDKKRKLREEISNNFSASEMNVKKIKEFLKSIKKSYEGREKFKFLLLKALSSWQNNLFFNGKYEKCAKSHIKCFDIWKEFDPDMACFLAMKIKHCYELAHNYSEAEKWLEKAKENDVFHNFDFFLKRFKKIL